MATDDGYPLRGARAEESQGGGQGGGALLRDGRGGGGDAGKYVDERVIETLRRDVEVCNELLEFLHAGCLVEKFVDDDDAALVYQAVPGAKMTALVAHGVAAGLEEVLQQCQSLLLSLRHVGKYAKPPPGESILPLMRLCTPATAALWVGLLTSASVLDAQTFAGYVTAGPTFTQVQGDDLAGYNRAGVFAGVGVWLDLSDRWRTSLTIAYDQAGSNASSREQARTLSQFESIELNYVSVPVAAHYMDWLSEDELYYHLEFMAGLTYRRLISAEVTDAVGADVSDAFEYRDNVPSLNLGLLYAWSLKWGAGIYYNRGFIDIQGDPDERSQFPEELSLRLRFAF